jgi:predicted ATPase
MCSNQPTGRAQSAAGGRHDEPIEEGHQPVTSQLQQQTPQPEQNMAAAAAAAAAAATTQARSQLLQGVMHLDRSVPVTAGTQVGAGCCMLCAVASLPAACAIL